MNSAQKRAWRRYLKNKTIDTDQLSLDQCRKLLRLQDRLYLFAVSDHDKAFWAARNSATGQG